MRIPRRTVSIGFLSLAMLALSAAFCLRRMPPDKSADNAAGGSAEPVYRVGRGVSLPRPIYTPSPEISPEAKEAKYQATVIVMAIVSGGGDVTDAKAVNTVGMGLDERAVEAVSRWKFKPSNQGRKAICCESHLGG
jgi:TonB family protein